MPLRIGNYGSWEGDRPGKRPGGGYHPPACTCYECNEGRRRRRTSEDSSRRPPPRNTGQGGQPTGNRSRTSPGVQQRSSPTTNRPVAKTSRKSSGLWLWWCVALVLVVYTFWAGLDALSTYRTAESPQARDLPALLVESAGAPFRDVAGSFSDFDRTASYQVAVSDADPVEVEDRPALAPPPTAAPLPEDPLTEIGTIAMSLVNDARAEHGLPPLETSAKLVQIATKHSGDMAKRGYFSHDSPGGETYLGRYQRAGFTCRRQVGLTIHQGGENIFQGHVIANLTIQNWRIVEVEIPNPASQAEEAVEGWLASPGHRRNIMNRIWQQQGIGAAITDDGELYITQNFC